MSFCLKCARLVSLTLASASALAAASTGLNALLRSKGSKKEFGSVAPTGVDVHINVQDLFIPGAIATSTALFIFVVTTVDLLFMLRPIVRRKLAATALQVETGILMAAWVVLLVSAALFTHRTRVGHARVTASLLGTQLPQSLVDDTIRSAGISTAYRDISYLLPLQVTPWFALLFTGLSAATTLVVSRRLELESKRKAIVTDSETSLSEKASRQTC